MSFGSISKINNINSYTLNSSRLNNTLNSDSFSDILNSVNSGDGTTNYNQIFEKVSKEYNVPVSLLKAIAKAESNFNPNAVSGCGAQGIMQLMPATPKSLGVSDSFDAEQNIMGGAKYLSQMLTKFNGNTELALAAYNAGPGNVIKYGGIPPFKETQNYVTKVMGYCGDNRTECTIPNSNATGTDTNKTSEIWERLSKMQLELAKSDTSSDTIADTMLLKLLQYQLSQRLMENVSSTEVESK